MHIAIVGSRDFPSQEIVFEYVRKLPEDTLNGTIVVSGGAKGVDTWAELAAMKYGLETYIIKPDWNTHGKAAGILRNQKIVAVSDYVSVFWDGKSKGTSYTLNLAIEEGKLLDLFVRTHERDYSNKFRLEKFIRTPVCTNCSGS